MKKYGKYEKMPDGTRAKQPPVKSMLLQTYFTSLLCLVLCVTMFFGTSYAWFTSEVQNTGNEIYIGTLDVELQKKTGEDSWTTLDSTNQEATKLFSDAIRWEPGYTAVETVKIVNEGDLAFRYLLYFTDGTIDGKTEVNLLDAAEWFDVWVYRTDENTIPAPANYEEIKAEDSGWTKVGTLAELLDTDAKAVLMGKMDQEEATAEQKTEHIYTIALHMSGEDITEEEQSGLNALMGQKISLNVKLVATQYSSEEDAFNANYDLGAFACTLAQVNSLEDKSISYQKGLDGQREDAELQLDTAYQFLPNETLEEAQESSYRYYHADYVVYADKEVPANSIALAGYYQAWCELLADNRWVALTNENLVVKAGDEIRLIQAMGGGSITVNYEDICQFGNDGIGFLCGAADISEGKVNAGTTITVELRMYETEEPSEANGNSHNVETGRYITVGKFEYTFPAVETAADQ